VENMYKLLILVISFLSMISSYKSIIRFVDLYDSHNFNGGSVNLIINLLNLYNDMNKNSWFPILLFSANFQIFISIVLICQGQVKEINH
jgi:hypothetical protein